MTNESSKRLDERHLDETPMKRGISTAQIEYLAQLIADTVKATLEKKQLQDGARVVQRYRRLLRDTVRMIGLVNAAVADSPIDLRAYRSAKSVEVLYDRLLTVARKLGWAKLLEADVAPTQVFPAPPIPSDERFSAITNVAEIIQEAERMKHCVVTRAADVAAGACALYRVNVTGERATLELSLGPSGEPLEIDQFRLACNAEPSQAAGVPRSGGSRKGVGGGGRVGGGEGNTGTGKAIPATRALRQSTIGAGGECKAFGFETPYGTRMEAAVAGPRCLLTERSALELATGGIAADHGLTSEAPMRGVRLWPSMIGAAPLCIRCGTAHGRLGAQAGWSVWRRCAKFDSSDCRIH